jgi:hypothetical protein
MKSGELHSSKELIERVGEKSITRLRELLEAKKVSPEVAHRTVLKIVRVLAEEIFEWARFKDDKLGLQDEAALPSEVVTVAEQAMGHAAKLQRGLEQLKNWNEVTIDFDVAGPRKTRKGVAQHIEDLRRLQVSLEDFVVVIREPPNAPKLAAGIRGFRRIALVWEDITKSPLPCSAKKTPPSPFYQCLKMMIDEIDPSGEAAKQFTANAYVTACKKGANASAKEFLKPT